MEAARLEQDRKMRTVLEGIMARLGAGPLPLAEVMTLPRGGPALRIGIPEYL